MAARPTLKTVAQAVGVTANTVSLALRGSPLVAEKTKTAILAEARRQGYQHDAAAQALRCGRSRVITLAFGDIANPLFAIKIKLLAQQFAQAGYETLILNTDEAEETEVKAIRTALSRKVEGVVLCPCQKGREALELLHGQCVPCVLIGRQFDSPQEDAVVWDDRRGGYLATRRLLELGCRQPLYLTATPSISSARLRLEGFRQALAEAGMPENGLVREVSPLGDDLGRLLDTLPKETDGVFAFNDLLAWRLMCMLKRPLPVVGFDDIQSALAAPIPLSSIHSDLEEETRLTARLLLERIEQPERPLQTLVMPVSLTVRDARKNEKATGSR